MFKYLYCNSGLVQAGQLLNRAKTKNLISHCRGYKRDISIIEKQFIILNKPDNNALYQLKITQKLFHYSESKTYGSNRLLNLRFFPYPL